MRIKKIHPFDSTPICVVQHRLARQYLVYLLFVAYAMYSAFLFCPSIYSNGVRINSFGAKLQTTFVVCFFFFVVVFCLTVKFICKVERLIRH